jgi:hypothetical protein
MPKPLRRAFPSHDVRTTAQMQWQDLRNGRLLTEASSAFDIFLTVDKNIKFQQNLDSLPVSVIVLDAIANTLKALIPFAPFVESAMTTIRPGQLVEITADGKITAINEGRDR